MLKVTTLGGLDIRCEGEPVTGFATRKVEALLVYLVCTGRPRAREVLAELLWEERTQSRAMSNLRVALSSLRKHLAPYFVITRDTVALNPDEEIWLDVAELEKQPAAAREQKGQITTQAVVELENAVGLYQGDFLEGFYVRGSYGFENWMVLERERIRALYEQNLQLLLDALLGCQRWRDVIDWGERWIAQGGCPEPAFRAIMNAYAGLGDLVSVMALYQRCVEALDRELGIEPSERTQATYQHLASGGKPEVPLQVQATELQAPTADSAARLLLTRWRLRPDDILDVASLAVVYASRADLGIGPEEARLLIRSALHHGVDVEPWLRRLGSPAEAVAALDAALERYPRPGVRLQIVEALKGLQGQEATESLVSLALTDDATEVRIRAALAAAARGRLEQVAVGLVDNLQGSDGGAPLAALVAVADAHGLPHDIGPYPRLPVAVALAQRRWHARRGEIIRQAVRAGCGAALAWTVFGMTTPFYAAWQTPEDFAEVTERFISAAAWGLGGALLGFIIGGIIGTASGLAVGLADALWTGPTRHRWRLLFGGLAGLVHSAYLILFTLAGAYEPEAVPAIHMPAYVVYGVVLGLIIAFVIPPLGTSTRISRQFVRSVVAGFAGALVTVPYTVVVYPGEPSLLFFSRLLNAFLLPFGTGLVFSSRARESALRSEPREFAPTREA